MECVVYVSVCMECGVCVYVCMCFVYVYEGTY